MGNRHLSGRPVPVLVLGIVLKPAWLLVALLISFACYTCALLQLKSLPGACTNLTASVPAPGWETCSLLLASLLPAEGMGSAFAIAVLFVCMGGG